MRLKKKSKLLGWRPRWFKLDAVSLALDYFADAECTRRLGSIAFSPSSGHVLHNGILSLNDVREVAKGGGKSSYVLRHNDARALQWWDETLLLAEQGCKLRLQK
jgi:hypothetical protein